MLVISQEAINAYLDLHMRHRSRRTSVIAIHRQCIVNRVKYLQAWMERDGWVSCVRAVCTAPEPALVALALQARPC